MFEVGFSELLLIMGLALLVLGPEKLPKVVSEIGRWMGRARAMARQFREQLEDEAAGRVRNFARLLRRPEQVRLDALHQFASVEKLLQRQLHVAEAAAAGNARARLALDVFVIALGDE